LGAQNDGKLGVADLICPCFIFFLCHLLHSRLCSIGKHEAKGAVLGDLFESRLYSAVPPPCVRGRRGRSTRDTAANISLTVALYCCLVLSVQSFWACMRQMAKAMELQVRHVKGGLLFPHPLFPLVKFYLLNF
jgi:hypothetical protein